jgi:Rrf2 family protein
MLCLSQTTGYAIQALGCLSAPAGACHRTAAVARCANVPKPYLVKIIQALARKGLVNTRRGVGGGIVLARPPERIALLEVVEAVEGEDWLGDCLLNLDDCSSQHACPTHGFWQRIRQEISAELEATTLASVIAFQGSRRASRKEPAEGSACPAR